MRWGTGDIVTWQEELKVAQYMGGDVAEQGQATSPGSGGASPYLRRGSPGRPRLRRRPQKPIVRDGHGATTR
jgi:hypothetical protein